MEETVAVAGNRRFMTRPRPDGGTSSVPGWWSHEATEKFLDDLTRRQQRQKEGVPSFTGTEARPTVPIAMVKEKIKQPETMGEQSATLAGAALPTSKSRATKATMEGLKRSQEEAAEIEILQRLAERRDTLQKRERELDMREGLLGAAERRIDRKVTELRNLEATISSLIKTFDEQQEKKMQSLVKIYESMKPKEAARIFEDLEMDTLLEVAERMKERKLAPIMAKMNPEKAREVTVQLRELRQLPNDANRFGG